MASSDVANYTTVNVGSLSFSCAHHSDLNVEGVALLVHSFLNSALDLVVVSF